MKYPITKRVNAL